MSHTHTTSAAPAPVLSPATVALSSTAKSVIALLHSAPASPELLFYLNARDLPALRTIAPSVSNFLKGRKGALERYLAENESKEVRVSEKTKSFWLEKKSATEDLQSAFDDADKSDSELSESGRKTREEYFEKTKAAWEVDLALVLNKLCTEFIGPFALGEQVSIVDVHLAAWLHELVILSGGSTRDSGAEAMARLEKHVGGGFTFAKDAAPSTTTVGEGKLAVVWETLASRPSWRKVFGDE